MQARGELLAPETLAQVAQKLGKRPRSLSASQWWRQEPCKRGRDTRSGEEACVAVDCVKVKRVEELKNDVGSLVAGEIEFEVVQDRARKEFAGNKGDGGGRCNRHSGLAAQTNFLGHI